MATESPLRQAPVCGRRLYTEADALHTRALPSVIRRGVAFPNSSIRGSKFHNDCRSAITAARFTLSSL